LVTGLAIAEEKNNENENKKISHRKDVEFDKAGRELLHTNHHQSTVRRKRV